MRNIVKLSLIAVFGILTACNQSGKDVKTSDSADKKSNQALYNQAMDIHDEVMPKMDDLVTLKSKLKDSLDNKSIVEARKNDLENRIHLLDSAYDSMMDWMHDQRLRPPQDTTNHPSYKAYMEAKLESAKLMKSLILDALEKAKL